MALSNHLLHLIVHSSTENPRCRTVYRPRSEQFVEYLAHASKTREQHEEDAQRKAEQKTETEQQRSEQRAYIEQRLRDVAAFEKRFNPGYRSRRKRN